MKHFFLSPAHYILLSQVFFAAMFIPEVEENVSFNKTIKCTLQDIYLHDPNIKWNDIIGLDAAKQLVKEAIVYPIRVSMGNHVSDRYQLDKLCQEGKAWYLISFMLAFDWATLGQCWSIKPSPRYTRASPFHSCNSCRGPG